MSDPRAECSALLADCLEPLLSGALTASCLPAAGPPPERAAAQRGHFHLVPEFFIQRSGWSAFRWPGGRHRLVAGAALLVPPQVWHAETVGGAADGPFSNLVVQAESGALTVHRAEQGAGGQPRIACLSQVQGRTAVQVQAWLTEAARIGAGSLAQARTGAGGPAAGASWHASGSASVRESGIAPWAPIRFRALLGAALGAVLQALEEAGESEAGPTVPAWLAQVPLRIRDRLGDPALSVAALAGEAGCTPDHLSEAFRHWTGESIMACITRLRLARAEALLVGGQLAGKQVAWACGFASHSYFCRVFQRHHGCSPGTWAGRHPT